jgi:DNA invertase Pin-like site-specific DNA recombinase
MRVGLARVSTTKRAQDVSIEGQVQQLEAAGCDRVLAERASAYQKGKRRPAWEELWSLVAAGVATEVIVIDQSRLSRSGDDMAFLAACAQQGVRVRALTGGEIEVESYSGFVTAGVLSVMNQASSRLVGAKVRDGLARRRAAGYLGTGRLPFGYCSVDGRAAPDPTTWAQARARFDGLLAAGMNINQWIRDTGAEVSHTGVRRWLDHPMLRGFAHGQWGAVPALITWQEWEQATRMRQSRASAIGRTAGRLRLFTGLVSCSECGRSCHRQMDGDTPRLKCKTPSCSHYGRSIQEAVVRGQVLDALRTRAAELAELANTPQHQEPPEAIELRAQLHQLEALDRSGVAGLAPAMADLRARLAALQQVVSGPRYNGLAELFATPGTLELATDEELRAVVVEFVASVRFLGNPRRVEITLR